MNSPSTKVPFGLDTQFARQQANENTLDEAEKRLRNSRESFKRVRDLSPTRFCFRVVNQQGQDIRDIESTRVERPSCDKWVADLKNLTTDNRPRVAEDAGCYRLGELSLV